MDYREGLSADGVAYMLKVIVERNSFRYFHNALNELAELDDYAEESGLTPPSPVAKKFAREILGILTSRAPRHYSVSLWEDGDVVIYSGNTEWRVSVYCRADGGAAFYVSSPNNHDHDSEYQLAQDMPVDPIIDTLNKIPA